MARRMVTMETYMARRMVNKEPQKELYAFLIKQYVIKLIVNIFLWIQVVASSFLEVVINTGLSTSEFTTVYDWQTVEVCMNRPKAVNRYS